jgi:hypothetical protein
MKTVNRTALLRAPLFGFVVGRSLGLGEEVDLLRDDLATVAVGAILVGPFGVMNASRNHDHRALGDMLSNAFSDAVEAGDAVPFGFSLAIALGVFEAAGYGQRYAHKADAS